MKAAKRPAAILVQQGSQSEPGSDPRPHGMKYQHLQRHYQTSEEADNSRTVASYGAHHLQVKLDPTSMHKVQHVGTRAQLNQCAMTDVCRKQSNISADIIH